MNGYHGAAATAYGHLGDTYGAVADCSGCSDEPGDRDRRRRGGQEVPLKAICESYFHVAAALGKAGNITACHYAKGTYYRGTCRSQAGACKCQ
jgi:hypothetical protein